MDNALWMNLHLLTLGCLEGGEAGEDEHEKETLRHVVHSVINMCLGGGVNKGKHMHRQQRANSERHGAQESGIYI